MYCAERRVAVEILCLSINVCAFLLTFYINFLNHARRPQSRKGRLAADAYLGHRLRQRRDDVKENYYV